jgi:hypothetical protein
MTADQCQLVVERASSADQGLSHQGADGSADLGLGVEVGGGGRAFGSGGHAG